MDYLPKDATIEEACNWLQAKTGQTWVLARLLECHLVPHFWLEYTPGFPAIFGNRFEGYQTRMMFQGDLCRLESDRVEAFVSMFAAHDGSLIKVEPAFRVPLSELRFKRQALERVAEIVARTAQGQRVADAPASGEPGGSGESHPQAPIEKRWTAERLAELRSYREEHGTRNAAEHFKVSEQRVRRLLPKKEHQLKGYSPFNLHSK